MRANFGAGGIVASHAGHLISHIDVSSTGMGGNISGVSTGNGFSNPEEGLLSPNQQTRVRGLSGADLTRDFFATDIGMDSYNEPSHTHTHKAHRRSSGSC